MRILVAMLLLLGVPRVAEAKCKHKGTVLFRETQRRNTTVAGVEVHPSDLRVYATGAWDLAEDTPNGLVHRDGCLAKKHLAALKVALARAKFQLDTSGAGTCKAISTMDVVISSPKRKKQVATAAPCGTPLDDGTSNLVACAQLAGSRAAVGEIVMICRGQDPLE